MQPATKEISAVERGAAANLQACPDGSIEIMTAKEVASFLKISVKTVYSYASRRMMPIYWKFQNNVRFEKQQIIQWMNENNQAARIKTSRRAA